MTFLQTSSSTSRSTGATPKKSSKPLETSQEAARETLTRTRNRKLLSKKPQKIFCLESGWIFKPSPSKAMKGFTLNHLRLEFLDRMPHHTLSLDVCGPVLIIYRVPKTLKSQMSYASVEWYTQECFNIQPFQCQALNGWWDQSNLLRIVWSALITQIHKHLLLIQSSARWLCQLMFSLQTTTTLKSEFGIVITNNGLPISLKILPGTKQRDNLPSAPESLLQLLTCRRRHLISHMTLGTSDP